MSELDDLWKRSQNDSTPNPLVDAPDDSAPPKNHVGRVTAFAIAIARGMGLPKEQIMVIASGAYLHDVGKMAIPHAILLKPGPLTPEDTATMREHCSLGYGMVRKLPYPAGVDEIVYSHHECYDGTGYPRGLKGEKIPLGARIVAVANTWIPSRLTYRIVQHSLWKQRKPKSRDGQDASLILKSCEFFFRCQTTSGPK